MKKKGQFDFVWIFAIFAGVAILFLAIYGSMKFGETTRLGYDSELSKSLSILIDPMQAGFADASFGKISFRQETRINNFCYSDGVFGENQIGIQTRSDVGSEWGIEGARNPVKNKYIFSEGRTEGNEFFVLSFSFDFPYKVSDIVVLTPEHFCFVETPRDIRNDIERMGLSNVEFEDLENLSESECRSDFKRVCFGSGTNCDISVYGTCVNNCADGVYSEGRIVRRDGDLVYVGDLLYAGIFADSQSYECNVERILHRSSEVARVFVEKADLMTARNCNSNLQSDLIYWRYAVMNATQNDLSELRTLATALERKNSQEDCRLWF